MSHNSTRVGIFADQDVGLEAVRFLLREHRQDVELVVTIDDNEILSEAHAANCQAVLSKDLSPERYNTLLGKLDCVFLAWWPHILPKALIDAVPGTVVNFHPSFLPYNRGKHYNFWTIVEDTPFGVSLHVVDAGVDTGDILVSSQIEKSWEDTGGSLYHKAKHAILELFMARYGDIVEGRLVRMKQDLASGTFHRAREIDFASEIDLSRTYVARDLINLLRARTFEGKPACFFNDQDNRYEIRVTITRDAR